MAKSLLTPSDTIALFPRTRIDTIRTEAENAWHEGKNSNANPYIEHSFEYNIWYKKWYECNLYC